MSKRKHPSEPETKPPSLAAPNPKLPMYDPLRRDLDVDQGYIRAWDIPREGSSEPSAWKFWKK